MKQLPSATQILTAGGGRQINDDAGQPMTVAWALTRLAERQFGTPQAQSVERDRAARKVEAQVDAGSVILEPHEVKALEAMLEAAYAPQPMMSHGLTAVVLNRLTDWVQSAEEQKAGTPDTP